VTLVLIAAVARNGVIGDGQRLLWQLPADMRHFRAATAGRPVIMGRKTWDSLPARFRPLPGRRNLVVTRQTGWQAPGAEAMPSLQAALDAAGGADDRVFVIGGGEIYAAAMPLADELLLTEVDRDYTGDTRFPDFDRSVFSEVSRQPYAAQPPDLPGFAFVSYRRR
jgi:dihydrofolate reductase